MTYREKYKIELDRLKNGDIQSIKQSYINCENWCDMMEGRSTDPKVEIPKLALASLKAQFTFIANILKEIE